MHREPVPATATTGGPLAAIRVESPMRKFIILLSLILISSCTKKSIHVTKFIFIAGQDIVYDSNQTWLSIRRYFECKNDSQIRYATGNRYYDSIAPTFGLDRFYVAARNSSLNKLIDNTFIGQDYSQEYNNSPSRWYYYFFIRVNDKKDRIIYFNNPDSLPPHLKSLYRTIDTFCYAKNLTPTKKFVVDSALIEFQDSVFRKFPPPPKPPTPTEPVHYIQIKE